jgi:alpha-ketoglutarate-dependent taurine dioxygenase
MTILTENAVDLRIDPVAGHIGAEISGVDLSAPLPGGVVETIRDALHRYKVVFFRDQTIGHAEQVAFARQFGAVTPAHPHEEDPPKGFPEILPIDSRRYERHLGRRRTSTTAGTPTSPHWSTRRPRPSCARTSSRRTAATPHGPIW